MAENGTLWLEYPLTGGPSPEVEVTVAPEEPRWFRRHASRMSGDLPWVGASGAEGLSGLSVRMAPDGTPPRTYTVTLYFAEPGDLGPGERVFDVALQGAPVLRGFDIAQQARGAGRVIARSFEGVLVGPQLTVELTSGPGSAPPVLCGIEAVAQ